MDSTISWFLTCMFAYFMVLCYYFIEFKWPELEKRIAELEKENAQLRGIKP